jgi:hypothetical protein
MDEALYQITKGIDFLVAVQNADGGVPATTRGDPSGCWTSAIVIEALCGNVIFPARHADRIEGCVRYLVGTQQPNGSWPVLRSGAPTTSSSTMATGQALSALVAVRELPFLMRSVGQTPVLEAIRQARQWLVSTQDDSGAWGIDPSTGGGKSPRTISTFYALHGLIAADAGNTSSSPPIRRGFEWLARVQGQSGGWPDTTPGPESIGSSARALAVLGTVTDPSRRSVADRGMQYLRWSRARWRLATEAFVIEGAPGQTRYHFNTLCDVGQALSFAKEKWSQTELGCIVHKAWEAQNDDGSWPLFDFNDRDENVTTWSTAEWIDLLLKCLRNNPSVFFGIRRRKSIIKILFGSE